MIDLISFISVCGVAAVCFYLYCVLNKSKLDHGAYGDTIQTLRLRIEALKLSLKTSEEDYEKQRKRIRELELRLSSQSSCRIWMRDMLQQILDTALASLFDPQWDMEKKKAEEADNSVD